MFYNTLCISKVSIKFEYKIKKITMVYSLLILVGITLIILGWNKEESTYKKITFILSGFLVAEGLIFILLSIT